MKKILLSAIAVFCAVISANAQVKIETPHPDLDIQLKRCAYASGTVVIDLVITNYGIEEKISFCNSAYTNKSDTIMAYDDEGNIYSRSVSDISIGVTNEGLSNRTTEVIMPQDIPIKFRIQLTKISAEASKLALLKLPLISKGAMALSADKPVQFRNLEWVK